MKAAAPLLDRKSPAQGVHISLTDPTIVFLTVCTKDRTPWLTQALVQQQLERDWAKADAWLVGRYVLMPDHVHLFCSPAKLDIPLAAWVRHWKRSFSLARVPHAGAWQRGCWDTRLRRHENYSGKWFYVRDNPVRAGLVHGADEWPFQGMLNVLRW